jgi:small-conductance mechanosensitive channel
LSALIDEIVRYLPSLFAGLVILFAALSLGGYVGRLVKKATTGSKYSGLVSVVAKYAIMFLGASMALDQLGVGQQVITAVVSAVLGGTALALGLAFGLGGRDKAKQIIDKQSEQ